MCRNQSIKYYALLSYWRLVDDTSSLGLRLVLLVCVGACRGGCGPARGGGGVPPQGRVQRHSQARAAQGTHPVHLRPHELSIIIKSERLSHRCGVGPYPVCGPVSTAKGGGEAAYGVHTRTGQVALEMNRKLVILLFLLPLINFPLFNS